MKAIRLKRTSHELSFCNMRHRKKRVLYNILQPITETSVDISFIQGIKREVNAKVSTIYAKRSVGMTICNSTYETSTSAHDFETDVLNWRRDLGI